MLEARIDKAVEYICTKTAEKPTVGLILGSGLGDFSDRLEGAVSIPLRDLPDFPVPTVAGHDGALVFGTYQGKAVVALRGRIHYYEGYPQQEITLPVRVMKRVGVETLLLTNAAGGINLSFSAGALMLISDHLNFSGSNPLIGANLDSFGPRFPDMSEVYTPSLRAALKQAARVVGIELQEGVYAMYSGPSYETPAEIRYFRSTGADAVGMSTVPEALVAGHCGMKVLGISCITNMAAGVLPQKLDHAEVVSTANRVKEQFARLVSLAIDLA